MSERLKLSEMLTGKDIILFGAGNYAKEFYRDFNERVNIIYCISNDDREEELWVNGRAVCPVKRADSVKITEQQIIILCAERYREMEIQLRDMGYRNGVHYINSGMVRLLFSKKRIALFYGVCYMRALYNCVRRSKEFQKRYEAFYWLDYRKMEPEEYEMFSFLLPLCGLFFYNTCVSADKSKRIHAYLSRLSKDCRTVRIPLVVFNGYHPRTSGMVGDVNPYDVTSAKTYYGTFLVPDENINRLLAQGKKYNEVIETVKDIDFYDKAWLKENYSREVKKMKLAERLADVKISDYLIKNHGKERLFLNETHMANGMILELARRILNFLEMETELPDEEIKQERLLFTSEMPVYPSVIEHLSLENYKGNPEYQLFTFEQDIAVTFEEYVERYYEYCLSMKTWIEKGYFPR